MRSVNYLSIPLHMREGARDYVEKGIKPGSFLYNILINDFVSAAGCADSINQRYLYQWAAWLINELPQSCWGSEWAVQRWIDLGGFAGIIPNHNQQPEESCQPTK